MIKPLGNRVVVEPVKEETATPSGIVLPETSEKRPVKGTVIAVGPGKLNEKGERLPMSVKEGDKVVFSEYSTSEFKEGDKKYLVVQEEDILGILE